MFPFDPCSPVMDPACVQPVDNDGHGGGGPSLPGVPDIPAMVGGHMLDEAAKSFQSAVGWLISNTAAWWVKIPSPDLEGEPAIRYLQHLVQPLTVAVAALALLAVAARMALSRKAVPLIDAGRGLVVLATITVIGTVLPNLLLQWGDQWSGWVLNASSQGDFAKRMTQIVMVPSGTPAALVLILCLISLIIGIIQAILLLFRGAALVILAGLLPLAATGMITTSTRSWFTRVAGWMLALIFYKPAAAAVYATAFTLVGKGKDMRVILMGFTMMLISLIAFPVLLKFFTWTTGGTESSTGGGILGALMGSATALGALRAYGALGASGGRSDSAGDHADYLDQQLSDQSPPAQPSTEQDPADQPPPPSGHPPCTSAPAGGLDHDSSDPSAPAGTGSPEAGQPAQDGHGWVPPDGGHGEPVGPTGIRAADRERRRSEDAIRWVANGGLDGSTGAAGEGGGGGGA